MPKISLSSSTSRTLISSVVAVTFWMGPVTGQQADPRLSCSIHFQARADWLQGLDGREEAIEMFQNYAAILWASVPQDLGMSTGFGTTSRRYRPDTNAVINLMTSWTDGNQGAWLLPLCMEDPKCVTCMERLKAVVR
jgi:hypothetical protein